MTKKYIDADDQNVATRIIYTSDGTTYTYDKNGVNEVPSSDMMNLFIKGVVAVKDGKYYKPLSCTEAGVIDFGIS